MKKTNHELLRCVRVQVRFPPFKVIMMVTLTLVVVLEGGQGNGDLDLGNDEGLIDFGYPAYSHHDRFPPCWVFVT